MRAREDQQRPCDDMSQLLDTVREMVVAVARLEKGQAEAKTLAKASEPEHVPPPPLLPAQFPHVPTTPSGVGILTPGIPVRVLLPK